MTAQAMGIRHPADREDRRVDRRALRRRGILRFVDEEVSAATAWADRDTVRRLRRINAVAATSFVVGGALFAVGAASAQAGVTPKVYCSVYLVGGVFFSLGGYATVLQAVNGPRDAGENGWLLARRWRWWASEPGRLEWMIAASLFVGTLVFAINIVDSFVEGLSASREDRLVWSPDIIGCALFLASGFLAMGEIGQGRWFWRRRRDLGWWIVAVNQVGSVLFMVSAVASFVRPSSGEELAIGIANWGTVTGALCFAVAGAMQERERPDLAPQTPRRAGFQTAPADAVRRSLRRPSP
jgi:hypothetical protein